MAPRMVPSRYSSPSATSASVRTCGADRMKSSASASARASGPVTLSVIASASQPRVAVGGGDEVLELLLLRRGIHHVLLDAEVGAAVEQQRPDVALGGAEIVDPAQHDPVVAAVEDLVDLTVQPGHDAVDHRRPQWTGRPVDLGELVVAPPAERRRDVLLLL